MWTTGSWLVGENSPIVLSLRMVVLVAQFSTTGTASNVHLIATLSLSVRMPQHKVYWHAYARAWLAMVNSILFFPTTLLAFSNVVSDCIQGSSGYQGVSQFAIGRVTG